MVVLFFVVVVGKLINVPRFHDTAGMLNGMLVQDGCAFPSNPVVIFYNILCQCTCVCIKVFHCSLVFLQPLSEISVQCMIFKVCTKDSVHNSTPGVSLIEEDPWDVTGYVEEIQEGLKVITMSSSPSTLLMASDTPWI